MFRIVEVMLESVVKLSECLLIVGDLIDADSGTKGDHLILLAVHIDPADSSPAQIVKIFPSLIKLKRTGILDLGHKRFVISPLFLFQTCFPEMIFAVNVGPEINSFIVFG